MRLRSWPSDSQSADVPTTSTDCVGACRRARRPVRTGRRGGAARSRWRDRQDSTAAVDVLDDDLVLASRRRTTRPRAPRCCRARRTTRCRRRSDPSCRRRRSVDREPAAAGAHEAELHAPVSSATKRPRYPRRELGRHRGVHGPNQTNHAAVAGLLEHRRALELGAREVLDAQFVAPQPAACRAAACLRWLDAAAFVHDLDVVAARARGSLRAA